MRENSSLTEEYPPMTAKGERFREGNCEGKRKKEKGRKTECGSELNAGKIKGNNGQRGVNRNV